MKRFVALIIVLLLVASFGYTSQAKPMTANGLFQETVDITMLSSQYPKFSFEYPTSWTIKEHHWDNTAEIKFDHYYNISTPQSEHILLHIWENVPQLIESELYGQFIQPFVDRNAVWHEIKTNPDPAIYVIDQVQDDPISVFAVFQCKNNVYRFRYTAFDSIDQYDSFRALLGSFLCQDGQGTNLSMKLLESTLPNLMVYTPVSSMRINTQDCNTKWQDENSIWHSVSFNDPTPNHYSCGECVWWASYSRPDIPDDWDVGGPEGRNNAHRWYDYAREHPDYEVSDDPVPGAIAVWGISSERPLGHVAYVTWVDGTSFRVTEMNYDNNGNLREYKFDNQADIHFILGGVTLFENANFDGRWKRITDNVSDLSSLITWQPSSVFLPSGWDTILYRHTAFDPNSYRQRWGELNFNALESSFWNLALDYYSDGANMNNDVGSATTSHNSCLLIPSNQAAALMESTCAPPPPLPRPPESPAPENMDQATFISHTTLPDHAPVSPGASLLKTWRVRNSGTSTWDGYKLIFRSGDQMNAPSQVDVPYTQPGSEIDISIPIVVPQASTRGDWQIVNSSGTWVHNGQLWVILDVQGTDPINTTAIDLECLDCPSVVAPGTTFRPTIRATVTSGQLQGVNLRGDMLRHKSGERYGAYEFIAVPGNTVINPGQTYDFTFYENDPLRAPDQEGDYETTWQVWRDNNWAGEEYTIHFKVRNGGSTNHPPNRPTLTGPGDWAVYQGTQPVLTAQHNGDPDGDAVNEYYFDIFESAQNANSGWISSNSWSPQGLGYNGYQWRAKVRDVYGNESDWSEQTWHFNILNNAAEIYDFHSETCREAWGGSEKVCFCADTNAGTLRVQINTASDGSTNGEWRIINELSVPDYPCASDSDRPPNLDPLPFESGIHVVRLYARREGGWENAAYQDITLDLATERKPNTPHLDQPQWQSYVNTLDVQFDWDETLRTNGYRLEVSDASDYSNLLVDQTLPFGTTAYSHTFTTDHAVVYWRVTATGPYGSNTGGSEFHFDLTSPTSNMSTLPPVTTDTKFTINWSGNDVRAGVRWYHIQMRDVSHPDSVWEDWLVNTTKTTEMFQGQPGHTYAFRIRAMDNIGNWESWPDSDYGNTHTQIDPSAAPPTAWWDANYAQKRNLVILNNDIDTMPADFPVHIHFDATTTPSAAEIYNASLSANKGDDVRVVYDNQTELHRFAQRFTPSEIDLWFPLQSNIGGGQTNNGIYQIYYGYVGASNPPSDLNTVFIPKVDGNTMGLWHFQDGSGSTVADTSGRNHTGAFQNAAWADGYLGYTGSFNGTTAYVEIAHSDDFKPGAITLEAWIYLTGSTGDYPMIFNKDRYWFRIRNDGEAQFMIKADGGDRTATSQTRLAQNRWYHVAATFDGNQRMRIYINGQLDREENNGAPPVLWNSQPLRIGRTDYDGNSYFPGYIHHARISNVERTDFSYARVDIVPSVETGVSITPPGSGAPDLAILDLTTYTNPGGGLLVMAAVQNQGDAPTQNNFYTDLYVNHLPTGAGDYTGTLQFWVNSPIVAGAYVTLTTVITDLGSMGGNLARALATPGTEVTATLYSQVDSAGVISETDNVNNISSGIAICLASADAYEGDDEISGASVIMPSQTQTHNFDSLADRDWVQFTAQGGVTYTLRTFGLGSGADTYLYLYESDGVSLTLLAANDDYGGSLASQIDWIAPATNTYYLLVQHWNPNVGGCGTSYKLSVKVQLATQTVYLPLVLRDHDSSAVPQTLRVYSGLGDGEIGNVNCTEWDACRNASFGNLAFSGYANATVESNYYTETETYSIKRLFFSFDTSAIPADAVIQSAVLNIYAGPYQSGSDRRVHVAQSTQASTLTYSNFALASFTSGGFVDLTPDTWLQIPLNATGQTWVVKGDVTRLALIHNLDLENITPTEENNALFSMAEDSAHQPYLTITYTMP